MFTQYSPTLQRKFNPLERADLISSKFSNSSQMFNLLSSDQKNYNRTKQTFVSGGKFSRSCSPAETCESLIKPYGASGTVARFVKDNSGE